MGETALTETAFTENQGNLVYPEGISAHYWHLARNWTLDRALHRDFPKGVKILEVGCARGAVVEALRSKGHDVWGVEKSIELAPYSSVKQFVVAGTGAEELDSTFRSSIQAILLLDVLEHLPEPEQFLADLLQSYPNVKRVLITVPARQELWSNYDDFYGHFRRYDLKGVRKLAIGAGCALVWQSYFFRLLYLPMLFCKAASVNRSTAPRIPTGVGTIVHRIIAAVCKIEYRLLPSYVPGSSIVAVFSR